MATLKCKISGDMLLMHNARLSDPLDPYSKDLKKLSSIKKKTDDNHQEMADLEFVGSLYHDPKIGPYIPGRWLTSSIKEGGAIQKNGTKIKQAITIMEDKLPLEYKGPRDIQGLQADLRFRDRRSAVVGMSRVMRTRPVFTGWSVAFEIHFEEDQIDAETITQALKAAGQLKGIGDFRPAKGGPFGRFEVESCEVF